MFNFPHQPLHSTRSSATADGPRDALRHSISHAHLSEQVVPQIHNKSKLEGKYSLESTDPRESEIRAHLRP